MKIVLLAMLAYGVIGPVIGAIAMLVLVSIVQIFDKSETAPEFSILSMPFILLFAIPVGYVVGGVQAVIVGFVTGLMEAWRGNKSILVPIAAALMVWAVFMFSIYATGPQTFGDGVLTGNVFLWLYVHLVPTVCVWLLMRSWRKWRTP